MKEWIVDIDISGSYQVVVEANTEEEALELAEDEEIEEFLTFNIEDKVAEEIK